MPEWLEFLLADTSALQLVFWIIAIVALIGAIAKIWPTLTQLVTVVNAVTGLPAFIRRTDETLTAQNVKIEEIHHEVNYNNGSSVKDAVARVELQVSDIDEGVASLHTKVDKQKVALEAADADLRHEFEQTKPRPMKE